jgi:PTH1 family peptidyl-tRNA hydrolase
MKMIIGLGNPGKEYQLTRHNLGFMILDELAEQLGINFSNSSKTQSEIAKQGSSLLLCKPQTFMNQSGLAVRSVLEYYDTFEKSAESVDDLFVVHDDLDIQLGAFKIQLGTGPKSHNGLLSIYEHLGTKNFWHVRAGVDNRGDLRSQLVPSEYVLQNFRKDEETQVHDEVHAIVTELIARV